MSAPTRRIGGTDVAKLLGLSRYGGPWEVYQRIVEGVEEPWNAAMLRGAAMEPILRAHGQRVLPGLELETLETDYIDSAHHEFARAQIDDLATYRGLPVVVEYKSQNRFARGWMRGGAEGDVIPPGYAAQVAWQLMCTERPLGLVVVGFGEDTPDGDFNLHNLVTFEVARDEQFERYCVSVAETFWREHVLPCVPPVPTRQTKRRAS